MQYERVAASGSTWEGKKASVEDLRGRLYGKKMLAMEFERAGWEKGIRWDGHLR